MTIEPIARDVPGQLKQHLDDAQGRFSRRIGAARREFESKLANDTREQLRAHVEALDTGVFCEQFGVIYLLAVLARVAPDTAKEATEWLAGQWDTGDSLGEWVWQWRDELAAGRPMTLPGVSEREGALDLDFGGQR